MKYNIVFSLLILGFFTGCTVNNLNNGTNNNTLFDLEVKKEKKIEYVREPISQDLKIFIKNVMNAFSKHNISKINENYINPEFGFYNLYKVDGNISFTHQKEIFNVVEEQTEEISHIISWIEKEAKDYALIEQDIKFDCSYDDDAYYGWNGEGLYISDKTRTDLSEMMIETNKYHENKYSVDDLNKAYFIEKVGYKVILTPYLIFYVNKIDDKWYITMFDRITTDCSRAEIENLDTDDSENVEETKQEVKK